MKQSNFIAVCVGVIAVAAIFLVYKEISKESAPSSKSVPPESAYNETKAKCDESARFNDKIAPGLYPVEYARCMEEAGYYGGDGKPDLSR